MRKTHLYKICSAFSLLILVSFFLQVNQIGLAKSDLENHQKVLLPGAHYQVQDLIYNGDFESGDFMGWILSPNSTASVIAVDTPDGQYSASLGGMADVQEKLSQTILIPNQPVEAARLSFWINLFGEEINLQTDLLCAGLYDGAETHLLLDLGCLDGAEAITTDFSSADWSLVEYPLSLQDWDMLQGEAIKLVFEISTNNSLASTFYIDRVAFQIEPTLAAKDIYEPNNSPENAKPAPIGVRTQNLTIDPAGDIDFFYINAEAGEILTADVDTWNHKSRFDAVLYLFDEEGNILEFNDDSPSSMDPYLSYTFITRGRYYVAISAYNEGGNPNYQYNILFNLTKSGTPSPTPPTDILATAQEIVDWLQTLAPQATSTPSSTPFPGSEATQTLLPSPTPQPLASHTPVPSEKKAWTAILYVDGDNDLCAFYDQITDSLEQSLLGKIGPTGFLNVIVLFDGNSDLCSSGETTLKVIQPGGLYIPGVNSWSLGELNMGDPATFVDFVRWSMQNYPAENYYLAIENHGGGIMGIAWDDSSQDHLTNNEVFSALKQITNNGANKISILAYEACLMGMYEVAYDVHSFTDYLFFFETISFADSNAYSNYFGDIRFTSSTTSRQLGEIIYENYYQKMVAPYTVTLVNSSQMENLHQTVNNLADSLLKQVPSLNLELSEVRELTQKIDNNGDNQLTSEDWFVDLWDLAEKLQQAGISTSEASAVQTAVEQAVVRTNYHPANIEYPDLDYSQSHGLSIFWPLTANGYTNSYTNGYIFTSTQDGSWDDFLLKFLGNQRRGMSADPGPAQRLLLATPATPTATAPVEFTLSPTPQNTDTPTPEIEGDLPNLETITPTPTGDNGGTGDLPNLPSPFELPAIGNIFGFLGPLLGSLPTILQWLIIILLILLLLFLLFLLLKWLWNMFKRKTPAPAPPTQPRGPLPVSLDCTPDWIKRLDINRQLSLQAAPKEQPNFQDTLLIGLGPAGREVLMQVADSLNTRFGSNWPENVRLLQVDIFPKAKINEKSKERIETPTLPRGMRNDQWVRIQFDLEEVDKNLNENPDGWEHWKWFRESGPNYERSRGRMALFYDLRNGPDNSAIWSALSSSMHGLNSPDIRVIGTTFDDVSSGMLVDIVRISQLIANKDIAIQLWLAGPMGREWSKRLDDQRRFLKVEEQQTRTMATLRELERFQRNTKIDFNYVPENSPHDILRQEYNMAVIQHGMFIFEPSGVNAPEDDVLACMADCLLALLHRPARNEMISMIRQHVASATAMINTKGIGLASAMGSYTVRVPGAPLARAMSWRMVRDSLFEAAIGLQPVELCMIENGQYRQAGELDDDLTGSAITVNRSEILKLVQDYLNHLESKEFFAAVRLHVDHILNGENSGGEPTLKRKAGLKAAQAWLEALRNTLNQYGARRSAMCIDNLVDKIQEWQNWLENDVYTQCKAFTEEAWKELERMRQQPGRAWDMNEKLDWLPYQLKIRPESQISPNVKSEPLLRMAEHFGWQICFDPNTRSWALRLLIPPKDFQWHPDANLEDFAIERGTNTHDIMNRLYSLAEPLVHYSGFRTAREIAREHNMTNWLEKATVRLNYNKSEASKQMGQVNEIALLIVQDSEDAGLIEEHLRKVPDFNQQLYLCKTQDSTSVSLVRLVDWIPLSTVELFSNQNWKDLAVDPSLYVWEPEQMASHLETNERLSSRFTSWIASDRKLLYLFGLGLIYEVHKPGIRDWFIPGIGKVAGEDENQVLQTLFDNSTRPDALKRSQDRERALGELSREIEARKQAELSHKYAYLVRRQREYIEPLLHSQDIGDRELGKYLVGLINEEKR